MILSDLKNELIKRGVPSDVYCLSGGLPNEAYVINCNDGRWEVYYSERGIKGNLRTFDDESEACFYILELISGG